MARFDSAPGSRARYGRMKGLSMHRYGWSIAGRSWQAGGTVITSPSIEEAARSWARLRAGYLAIAARITGQDDTCGTFEACRSSGSGLVAYGAPFSLIRLDD